MLAGLETVDDGVIRIGARDVTGADPKDRDVAMVFQNFALYPHMTVAQNMGFALKVAGVSKADIRDRVLDAARVLHLEACLDRRPKDLSGGERQRAAMGRAIVRRPQVFLMDEPLSTSTRNCGYRPAPKSPRCSANSPPPPYTSPTTRSKP